MTLTSGFEEERERKRHAKKKRRPSEEVFIESSEENRQKQNREYKNKGPQGKEGQKSYRKSESRYKMKISTRLYWRVLR